MKKLTLFFALLLLCVSIINGKHSHCERYENKIYRLTITYERKEPFYSILRLLPNGMFDEFSSVANGNSTAEVVVNYKLSGRVGYYACPTSKKMYLTSLGFIYKTEGVELLKKNGAIESNDYFFRFSDDRKKLRGKSQDAAYTSGTDAFNEENASIFKAPIASIKGERVKFRRRYKVDSGSNESNKA